VPTANSAAQRKPFHHPLSRFRRPALIALGLLAGLSIAAPLETAVAPPAAAAARPNTCSGWSSTTRPPTYIRVLRRQSGRVERVPFRKYVLTVLGKEWPGYLPHAVIEAGAVAVKQYAWFHALGKGRLSKRGQCFDVTDGVGDQLYKPSRARIRADHYSALSSVWNLHLIKDGRLFMTGYRTGSKGACGHDATGWKLFGRSATRCAYRGMGYQQILRVYYGPNLHIVSDGSGSQVTSQSAPAQVAPDKPASNPAVTDRPAVNEPAVNEPAVNEPNVDKPAATTAATDPDPQLPNLLDKLAEFDGTPAVATPDNGLPQVSELDSSQIVWRGTWQRVRSAIGSGEALVYSGVEGSDATFKFTGSSIELVGQRGPDQGWLEVFIDGRLEASVDAWSPTVEEPAPLFSVQWPVAAEHSIQLIVVASTERPRVDLDQVVIGA